MIDAVKLLKDAQKPIELTFRHYRTGELTSITCVVGLQNQRPDNHCLAFYNLKTHKWDTIWAGSIYSWKQLEQ